MNDIIHITSNFSDDLRQKDWKSKFYGDTIVMYFDDKYITLEDIFSIAVNNKKVQFTNMKSF
jgi:hypothetical protein